MLEQLRFALNDIERKTGHKVSKAEDCETLQKFGFNSNVDTVDSHIMELAGTENTETFVTSNLIDRIVSDNATNTQAIGIEGLRIGNNNQLTKMSLLVNLNGQTSVTFPSGSELMRVQRLVNYGSELANNSTVYAFQNVATTGGVPNDSTKVHCLMLANHNQSRKAMITTPHDTYFIITNLYADVDKATSASVNVHLKTRKIDSVGFFAWRTRFSHTISQSVSLNRKLTTYFIIPPNHDVLWFAISSAVNTGVESGFDGYYAKIIS